MNNPPPGVQAGLSRIIPTAILKPRRPQSIAWILPVAAIIAAAWLAGRAWSQRGTLVTVILEEGHGLKAGDAVSYRGIVVGQVRSVTLDHDTGGVLVVAGLRSKGDRLSRAGSRFWVVRPQLALSGSAGLETIVGPRYLAVYPGTGSRQRYFVGLNEPPVVESREPGDLEIILTASELGSLRRGAPVTYRQVAVGRILSVGLASDASGVEARLHVDKAFAQLIRQKTRFWDVGGLDATMGLTGFRLRIENLEALIAGGVALATPPEAGEPVRTGHTFLLDAAPPDGWLSWQPLAVIGSSLLPPGAPLPRPARATLVWTQGRLLVRRQRQRRGWVLQTDEGLLGPANPVAPTDQAQQETMLLEVAGTVIPLDDPLLWKHGDIAVIEQWLVSPSWPLDRRRRADRPEDCLAVGDPTAPPISLAAVRFTAANGAWAVDPAVSVDESWHGAAVVGRADGYLVGILLVDGNKARVALLPDK